MNDIYGMYDDVNEEVSYMKGGIHSDVTLKSVEFFNGESKKGNAYQSLNLNFEKAGVGTTIKHTERISALDMTFHTKPEKVLPNPEDEKARLRNIIATWNGRMKHIASKFDITLEELTAATAGVANFVDYGTKYAALLSSKLDDRKLYLKLLPTASGHANFPNFGNVIEVMAGPTNLAFTEWEDNFIKGIEYKTSLSSGSAEGTVTEITDDLESL